MSPEAQNLLSHLAGMPAHGHGTLTKSDLRDLLLETGGQTFANGRLYDITPKHLGAGVYRVRLKLWEAATELAGEG